MSDEILVKVEGVSKKFCRSLKKSLWYGVCDMAHEINPFGKNGSAGVPPAPFGVAPKEIAKPSPGATPAEGNRDGRVPGTSPLCPNRGEGQGEVSNSTDGGARHSVRAESGGQGTARPTGLRKDEFWAVNDISFELKRGECLGLIGRNGAGKTTLLKMLNGLIKPDAGRIEMRGRVGALIALGAGFNPILTGRENIYVNGSVLGLTKREIDTKMEDIIDFADIDEFIDSPVQSYSSGMQVRLGFAVATAMEPDVLILDEVLAVGDAAFRHKCYHRLNKVMSTAAVILVSHSMDYIAQTSSVVAMMRRGGAKLFRDTSEGIAAYNEDNSSSGTQWADGGKVEAVYPPVHEAQVRIINSQVSYGGKLAVEVEFTCDAEVRDVIFSFTAVNFSEQTVMAWHTSRRSQPTSLLAGRQLLRFHIEPLLLHEGTYRWNFNVARRGSIEHLVWLMRAGEFTVTSNFRPIGNIPYLVDSSEMELLQLAGNSILPPNHSAKKKTIL